MGLRYRDYLDDTPSGVYGCLKCKTHLSKASDVISKQFQGQHGQAFLFEKVYNVALGRPEDRQMTTGLHLVRDISCIKCSTMLGWTYIRAYDNDNQYKVGRFILEKKLLTDLLSSCTSSKTAIQREDY